MTVLHEVDRDLTIGQALDFGCERAMAGDHDNAMGLFRGVLVHEPENFEAIERLGASLFELKRYHEALYWFWRGRKISRKHPLALTNYGLCLSQLGHLDEGLAELERARYQADRVPSLTPQVRALIYNNLGNTLEKLKRFPEALAALDKGLSYSPDEQFAIYTRSVVLLRLNRIEEGIAALDRAIALKANDADAHYNRGLARLLTGHFEDGFADYEYRLITTETEKPNFGLPLSHKWAGESLAGKVLLVHGEQGLGDYIQFLRFLPALVSRGAKVVLVGHSGIAQLASTIPGVTVLPERATLTARHTKPDGSEVKGYDYWVAMMSLPLLLGIKSETDIPWPWCPPIETERGDKWRSEVKSPAQLNVGVVWAGNWMHKNDAHRSIPLKDFAHLFDVPGAQFVSLQQMRSEDRETFAALKSEQPNLRAFYFDDLRDTAAAILNLDVVVTVDTAVAHLAASLNVPTFILVPAFSTDWRWQLNRTDSPWYPSAGLYRQSKVGDWASVLDRLKSDLSTMAALSRAA